MKLTSEQYQKALDFTAWVICSEHELPSAPDDVRLILAALVEAHQDKVRLTKLIELSKHGNDWLSDAVFDLVAELPDVESRDYDPQGEIRTVIDNAIKEGKA